MTARSNPRLLCVGHAAHDLIYRVPEIPSSPRKVLATSFREAGGGMAANAAVAAARLGARVSLWARVADDRLGDRIVAELAAEGVDTSGIRRIAGRSSPCSAILVGNDGERLVCSYSDPDLEADPEWLPVHRLTEFDAVLVDTRWRQGAARVLEAATARRIPTVLDADVAPPETLNTLLPLATHIVFSEPGLQAAAPGAVAAEALAHCAERTAGLVGVTQGERGFLYRDRDTLWRIPAPTVTVVDTLAAGDVWHAALACGLAVGQNIVDAGRFANAAASLKCTREGGRTATPPRADVDALLAGWRPAVAPASAEDAV